MRPLKKLILPVILLMAIALSTACGSGTNTPGNTSSGTAQGDQAGVSGNSGSKKLPDFPLANPVTLKVFTWSQGDYDPEVATVKKFEELTNLHLEFNIAADGYDEKLGVLFASGDWPDILMIGQTGGRNVAELSQLYGQQGRFVNLMDYLEEMPNVKAYYEKYPNSYDMFKDSKGDTYLFPYIYPYNTIPTGFFVNETAFTKNSIKIPESVEELYEASKALKKAYPDSYPVTSYTIPETLSVWGRCFSTTPYIYYKSSQDAYIYGPFEENYKKMLQYLNKLYTEGLYDPEFPQYSFADDNWRQKLANGKSFISESYVWEMQYENANSVNSIVQAINKGDEVKFKYIKPLKNAGEDTRYWGLTTVNPSYGACINAKSKYVGECLKLLDWELGQEYYDLLGYGVEGVTYKTADGKKQFLDNITLKSEEAGKEPVSKFISWYTGINLYEIYPDPVGWKENLERFTGYTMDAMADFAEWPVSWSMNFPAEDKEKQAQAMASAEKMVQERSYQFMTGNLSFDKYDQFVNDLKALGIEDIVKYHNDFYQKNVKK